MISDITPHYVGPRATGCGGAVGLGRHPAALERSKEPALPCALRPAGLATPRRPAKGEETQTNAKTDRQTDRLRQKEVQREKKWLARAKK